jgi:hypothetical protein
MKNINCISSSRILFLLVCLLMPAFLGKHASADEWLTTQKLYGNKVEAAVRYPHEPGYDTIRVVTINCNTRKVDGNYGRDMSPDLIRLIASKLCSN